MKVILDQKLFDDISRHAEEDYPNECCGFFFGKDSEERRITHAYRVSNTKEGDRRRRFKINPDDYRKAERFALNNDLDFLGVYHSHPDHPAEASEHDRKVAMPYFSYIIVSVQDGRAAETRSWQLNEERQFEEEEIEVQNLNKQKVNQ